MINCKKTHIYSGFLILISFLYSCSSKNDSKGENTDPVYWNPSIKSLTEAIIINPDNASLYFQRSIALSRIDQDSLALLDLLQAHKMDSMNTQYLNGLAQVWLNLNRPEEAVAVLRKSVLIDPRNLNIQFHLAEALIENKDHSEASELIDRIRSSNPNYPETYYWSAQLKLSQQDTLQAIQEIRVALGLDSGYYSASLLLSDCLSAQGNPEAIKLYRYTFSLDTMDVLPLFEIGYFYEQKEDWESAKAAYTECAHKDPDFTYAFIQSGKILLRQDSLQKAIRIFQLAINTDPSNADAYFYKGHGYEKMNMPDSALKYIKQSLRLNPDMKEGVDALNRLHGKAKN